MNKVEMCLDILIKEANKLRVYAGKPFLSMKDIETAWYSISDVYPKDVLKSAKRTNKIVFKPKIGMAKVDRIISNHVKQERTDIKLRSMQFAISKRVRVMIYRIAYQMELLE